MIGFTIAAALTATAILLVPGTALGWLLARREWPGKTLVETLITLPLVVPPVATGLILLRLFGARGPLGALLRRIGVDVVFTWKAVVMAMTVMALPLFVRHARVAIEEVSIRYEQIARTLGAGEPRVLWTITLPMAARGLAAGAAIAFARALGEFGATVMVAGNIPGETSTIALSIFNAVQLGHDAEASRLAAVSIAIAFAAVWTSERLIRRRR